MLRLQAVAGVLVEDVDVVVTSDDKHLHVVFARHCGDSPTARKQA